MQCTAFLVRSRQTQAVLRDNLLLHLGCKESCLTSVHLLARQLSNIAL